MLARSSSPKEQGSLPGMADSSSFICPQCLLTFLCLAGISPSLQSSIGGLLGVQAFSQPGEQQQWGDEPCRVNSKVQGARKRAHLSKHCGLHIPWAACTPSRWSQAPPVVWACAMLAGTRMGDIQVEANPPREPQGPLPLHINNCEGGQT